MMTRWRWPLFAVGFYAALVVGFWTLVWVLDFSLDDLGKEPVSSLEVRDGEGQLLRQEMSSGGFRESWEKLALISPHLVNATLASEDKNFYHHDGVDWLALVRSAWLNLIRGSLAYGGSTITMQLVRLTSKTERTLLGKLKQMVLAVDLEHRLTKDEILEQYLNRVYYGGGVWGAKQAARYYFNKSVAQLSVGEGAMLAVIPRGPTYYDPLRYPDRAEQRREQILTLMFEEKYIDQDARSLASRSALVLGKHKTNFDAPHFVEFVKARLPVGFRKGVVVHTTLDRELQHRIERAVRQHVDKLAWRHLTQAAVVVLRNSDGAILSMVGSRDYWDWSNNGAYNGTTARLRPGSTLKPFVYGVALENGDTPASIAYDVVLPEDRNQFYSKDVRSHGFARYREALAGSYNLSAVHTLQRVGIARVLAKLRRAGLVTLDRPDEKYDWGLAIGHADVRLLDLTAAFSTFARRGKPAVVRAIESVTNSKDDIWREEPTERSRVFSEEVSYLIFDILSDPDARRPMFGSSVPMNLPFKVALKTGTTKAFTDLWALGTTNEFTVGVWAGNFDGSPTHQVRSVHGATPLMRAVYTALAARYGDPTAPARPNAIVQTEVCRLSGKLPNDYCEHRKQELFIRGQVPKERCDWHRQICGNPRVVYPEQVLPWVMASGKYEPPNCEQLKSVSKLRIVAPVDGAHFVLEPHRLAKFQRPKLSALPPDAPISWTINGQIASQWIPIPGTHTISATLNNQQDHISITYE